MELNDFKIGQKVFILAFGHWYEGEVSKLGRSNVHVTYTTGAGVTRTKSVKPEQVLLERPDSSPRQLAAQRKADRQRAYSDAFEKAVEEGRVQVEMDIKWKHRLDPVRTLAAFQALSMPTGFYNVTHKRARQVIEETTGIKVTPGAKPPRVTEGGPRSLEEYMAWVGDHCEPVDIDSLPYGSRIVIRESAAG